MSAHDVRVLVLDRTKAFDELANADLIEHPVWAYVPQDVEDPEGPIAPVRLTHEGRVPYQAGEVWCLCDAVFADGSHHGASGLCEANGHSGPLAISVFLGTDAVPVMVHPAPVFVLEKEGPNVLAKKFGRHVDQVFPITITVLATFEDPPPLRKVVIQKSGRV